jgi:DNA polymerase-3 subunit alpha
VGDLVLAEVTPTEEGGPGRLVLDDVAVGGIVSAVRALKTKKGDPMAVFTLEDHQGAVEVVVFPEAYGRFRSLIEVGALLLVRGKFERDDDSSRFQAAELSPLEALRERLAKAVSIHLRSQATSRATLEALWDLLAQHQGDRPIVLEMEVARDSRRLRVRADVTPQIRVKPSEQLVSAVERLCGAGSVVLQ